MGKKQLKYFRKICYSICLRKLDYLILNLCPFSHSTPYLQVKIEGFDPEKFRRANSTATKPPPSDGNSHSDIFILKQKPANSV